MFPSASRQVRLYQYTLQLGHHFHFLSLGPGASPDSSQNTSRSNPTISCSLVLLRDIRPLTASTVSRRCSPVLASSTVALAACCSIIPCQVIFSDLPASSVIVLFYYLHPSFLVFALDSRLHFILWEVVGLKARRFIFSASFYTCFSSCTFLVATSMQSGVGYQ